MEASPGDVSTGTLINNDRSACDGCSAGADPSAWSWKEHFKVLQRNNGNYKVLCNYCQGEPITGGATRFKKHLLSAGGVRPCSQAPDQVVADLRALKAVQDERARARRKNQDELVTAEREAKRQKMRELSHSLSSGTAKVNHKWKQTTVEECDGAAALEAAQQTIARMWYRAAIPFHAVAFREVVDAFDAVCEYGATTGSMTFSMPSAPSLRNNRLEQEVKRIQQELQEHQKQMHQYGMSLQSDGKDCMSRRHLVNIITTTPLGPQFREVVDVSGLPRDAGHTASVLLDAIERLPEADKKSLVTVITDTPNVNKKAWEIIERKLPHVQCVPCAAHCCNLHFKHIANQVPEFNQIVDDCKLVVRRFANVDFAREMLRLATPKHTGGRKLEVYKPGDTRFASNFRMIDRLVTLRYAILQVGLGPEYLERCKLKKDPCPISHLIGSKDFWEQLEQWQQLLIPVYEMLREVDTYDARIHLVYESALGIQEHYKTSSHPAAAKCAEIWTADWAYLHRPIHSAAHILDPRYQSDNLKDVDEMWTEFLEVCEKVLGPEAGSLAVEQYSLYAGKLGLFGKQMAQGSAKAMVPHEWWSCYGAATPQLKSLAMKLLSQPASASSSEQSWSEYDFVHSKRRNRLKVSVASKLVYVHSNLRLLYKHRNCDRYTELLKLSVDQAIDMQQNLQESLTTDGWDGNCSDDEVDSNQSAVTHATAEPNSEHLDTNSFINNDLDLQVDI